MKLPPLIGDMRRTANSRRKLRLCLPFFLFWPCALIGLLVVTPALILLGVLGPFMHSVRRFLRGLRAGVVFGCALRGLNIAIEKENRTIRINVI